MLQIIKPHGGLTSIKSNNVSIIILIVFLLFITPSISAIQISSTHNAAESILSNQHIKNFIDLIDEPPQSFLILYLLIMSFLTIRINLISNIAITAGDDFWGDIDIQHPFFAIILLTLVWRFAFWYNFFDKIAENNNWELP